MLFIGLEKFPCEIIIVHGAPIFVEFENIGALFSRISEREICVDFNMYFASAFNIFVIGINRRAQREFVKFFYRTPIQFPIEGNGMLMFHSIKSNKLSIPGQFQFTRSR